MSKLTDLVAKQNEESYQLGKKHGAIEELEKIKADILNFIGGMNMCDDLDNEAFKKLDIRIEDIFDDHISELKGETNELERWQSNR